MQFVWPQRRIGRPKLGSTDQSDKISVTDDEEEDADDDVDDVDDDDDEEGKGRVGKGGVSGNC